MSVLEVLDKRGVAHAAGCSVHTVESWVARSRRRDQHPRPVSSLRLPRNRFPEPWHADSVRGNLWRRADIDAWLSRRCVELVDLDGVAMRLDRSPDRVSELLPLLPVPHDHAGPGGAPRWQWAHIAVALISVPDLRDIDTGLR